MLLVLLIFHYLHFCGGKFLRRCFQQAVKCFPQFMRLTMLLNSFSVLQKSKKLHRTKLYEYKNFQRARLKDITLIYHVKSLKRLFDVSWIVLQVFIIITRLLFRIFYTSQSTIVFFVTELCNKIINIYLFYNSILFTEWKTLFNINSKTIILLDFPNTNCQTRREKHVQEVRDLVYDFKTITFSNDNMPSRGTATTKITRI